mgnify:CR=1 FL=1
MILEIELSEGVTASMQESTLILKGAGGEFSRDFLNPKINVSVADGKVKLLASDATKREKMMLGTFRAHIRNMMKGVTQSHTYRLKICSGHFPMNVSVSGRDFAVKNFLGEKIPRKFTFVKNVDVKVNGQEIVVKSVSKEVAGQTAANIEQLTRVKGRDRRIFQDGIYIIEKDGKLIEQ